MSSNNLTVKEVSYLRARDPSILSYNGPRLEEIRVNLRSELSMEPHKKEENLRVYLRIKPGNDFKTIYKVSDNTLTCKVPPGSQILRNVREGDVVHKIFQFSKIFEPDTTQAHIFDMVIRPKILDVINGQNSTLLSYGVSGSGKTYTVIGTVQEPGLIPRTLEYMFRTLSTPSGRVLVKPLPTGEICKLDETDCRKERLSCKSLLNTSFWTLSSKQEHVKTYMAMQQRLSDQPCGQVDEDPKLSISIWVSFAEIYNEQIYDLLQPDPPRGKQRPKLKLGCCNGKTYIKNLTSINASSGLEAYQILQYGIQNLKYAETNVNKHSSRSHCIFTIKIVQYSEVDGGAYISYFNFCDLAGAERSSKTMNVGDRLKESNNINSSLLVLGRCISIIRDQQKNSDVKIVPFRESKLTQLFQKALSGSEDIAMIINISPCKELFDETQHALAFSAIVKDITIEHKSDIIKPKKDNRFSLLLKNRKDRETYESETIEENYEETIEELQEMNFALRKLIEQLKADHETEMKMNTERIMNNFEKLIEDIKRSYTRRLEDVEAYVRAECQEKIKEIEKYYQKKSKALVINLDSSSEEEGDDNYYRKVIENQKKQIHKLEQELTDIKTAKSVEKSAYDENLKLKEKVSELEKTLDDAVCQYKQLEFVVKVKDTENLKLKERIDDLENEVTSYREESFQVSEETSSDEGTVEPDKNGEDESATLN